MRRLLRNTLLVFVLCAASISATVLVARSQPLPERLAILHLDQCAPPCWIGITPDVTTFHEAVRIVKNTYEVPRFRVEISNFDAQQLVISNNTTQPFIVSFTVQGGIVIGIYLNLHASIDRANFYNLTYADIHSIYDKPTSVYISGTFSNRISLKTSLVYAKSNGYLYVDCIAEETAASTLSKRFVSSLLFVTPRIPTIFFLSPENEHRLHEWKGFFKEANYIHEACKYIDWC